MIFTETKLEGVFIVEPEKIEDLRGFFARSWCQKEFEKKGLNTNIVQCNISFNHKKGTLRGMHYQLPPNQETKLIRCVRGSIYDVVIDLRPSSKTFKKWFSIELTDQNRKMLYMPENTAHGYQTLCDDTEVFYQVTSFYSQELSRGISWNDTSFRISWPLVNPILSDNDKSYSPFISGE